MYQKLIQSCKIKMFIKDLSLSVLQLKKYNKMINYPTLKFMKPIL